MDFKNKAAHVRFLRSLYRSFKAGGCSKCHERDHRVVEAHHLNPGIKRFGLGSFDQKAPPSLDEFMEEVRKCIPLCKNCHAKEHLARHERIAEDKAALAEIERKVAEWRHTRPGWKYLDDNILKRVAK